MTTTENLLGAYQAKLWNVCSCCERDPQGSFMCVFLSTVPTLPVPKLAIACVGFNLSLVKKAWPALPASVRHRPSDNDVLMKK